MNDVRYALRMLARSPAFTAVAVLTLGLGIGATTALFTVVEGVLLEPLPFSRPGELVRLYSENPGENQTRSMTSPLDFDDWRTRHATFSGMAAYWPDAQTLTGEGGAAERLQAVFTTEDYFDVLGATALLGREVAALSPQVALARIRTLDDVVADVRADERFGALLLSLFGLVALVLASVGVSGVLAYAVAQRSPELGIRMALGADRGDVRAMVLGDGLRLVALGLAAGLVVALALAGFLERQLYGIGGRDPATLALVSGILLVAGALASLLPAWRATRVDPVEAMRAE